MKKIIIIIIILIIPLTGCFEEEKTESQKFIGTWIPCQNFGEKTGYHLDKEGNVYKVMKINGELYYTEYGNWELQKHVFVLNNQRLNYRFEDNKLYLYDLQDTKTETCYERLK